MIEDTDSLMREGWAVLLALLALFLVAILAVNAQPLTVNGQAVVPISCSDQGQCIATVGGQPIYFPGVNGTYNLNVPYSYTYDPVINVTTVQNVTVVNVTTVVYNISTCNGSSVNLSDLNITTTILNITTCNQSPTIVYNVTQQVVNVTNCASPPVWNVSVPDLQAQLVSGMVSNISTTCKDSCTLGDDEREELERQRRDAELFLNVSTIQYESALNISRSQYDALNATYALAVEDFKGQLWTAYGLLFMALLIAAVVVFVVVRRATSRKEASGRNALLSPPVRKRRADFGEGE